MRSGISCTRSVVGEYWISWSVSFWKMTLPGVVATFLPSSKAEISVCLMRRRPWPALMSSSRFFSPSIRLAPLLASVAYGVGGWFRRWQTGYLRSYVLFLVMAAVGIFVILSYFITAAG